MYKLTVRQPLAYTTYHIFCDASYGHGHKHVTTAFNVRYAHAPDKVILATAKSIRLKLNQSQKFNSHHAEGLALLYGLMAARDIFTDFSYSRVWVFTDDVNIVKWLKGGKPNSRVLHGMGILRRLLPRLYNNLANSHLLVLDWRARNTEGIKYSHNLAKKCTAEHN